MISHFRHATLRHKIADFFFEAIMRGQLLPGERIIERKLARSLGISQSALREALQDLELQGLVTKVDRRSTCITTLDKREIEDAHDVRLRYEPLVAAAASKRLTSENQAQLETLIEGMRGAGIRRDFVEFIKNNLAFYQIIWKVSGRKGLERALTAVTTPLAAFATIELLAGAEFDYETVCNEHEELLITLKTGGRKEVRKAFAEEMKVARQRYLGAIRKLQLQRAAVSKQRSHGDHSDTDKPNPAAQTCGVSTDKKANKLENDLSTAEGLGEVRISLRSPTELGEY